MAQRVNTGVVTGDILVSGRPLSPAFQRQTGYCQQQGNIYIVFFKTTHKFVRTIDIHMSTASVREALQFSAILRQSASVPKAEKLAYVEEIIQLLDMTAYAEAIIGEPGEGLNVEQRKRLTIGVELAAKPQLLIFLDEPTSGLDSLSARGICDLLKTLASHGQAILCTIHQPSSTLFQHFDRLLLLQKGGKTVYFGDIGPNSKTLVDYFGSRSGHICADDENPAECKYSRSFFEA